jgi:hypothetical protein
MLSTVPSHRPTILEIINCGVIRKRIINYMSNSMSDNIRVNANNIDPDEV